MPSGIDAKTLPRDPAKIEQFCGSLSVKLLPMRTACPTSPDFKPLRVKAGYRGQISLPAPPAA